MNNEPTLNKTELSAIYEKMEHPEKHVLCPRCGKELLWRGVGNSSEVHCSTKDCIWDMIRGI